MAIVTSTDGTAIAFDQHGGGRPVILVGGAFSYRRFSKMVQLAELLAERFLVINYDRRGRGESGDSARYAVQREIEDLAALIEAVGGSASVWGWSSGGVLALRAAAHGLNIEKLAIYEPPFMVDRSDPIPPADFADRLGALTGADRRGAAVRYYMTKGMGVPRPFVAAMRLTPFWPKLKAVAHTLPYDWAVMGDTMSGEPLRPSDWASVAAPTLVLSGERSPAQLRRAAHALADVLPNAEHRTLAKQSHNPSMKALAPVLAEFFATGEDARSGGTRPPATTNVGTSDRP